MDDIVIEDIEKIKSKIDIEKLYHKKIVITGACGFLGYYFMALLKDIDCKMYPIDNLTLKRQEWTKEFDIYNLDIKTQCDLYKDADYVVHAASIASPIYYRMYPIKTMEANVKGLWNILDGVSSKLNSMLFFSSSEVYGNPDNKHIPTNEEYNGNVSCNGPRSCYDESKRFGEALCMNYYNKYNIPIKVVRPFNNYGPGLSINDRRVLPDFCKSVIDNKPIRILSDGSPTRTFCYVSDAITGYMKVLLSDYNGEVFNIGNDKPEISMLELANLVSDGSVPIIYDKSIDKEYNTDSPNRRCPDITKAKNMLDYKPSVSIKEGIRRTLEWYRRNK